ncbi:MAG: ABC transporter substrate binding protein, partial [Alsobacter sp.]
SDGFTVENRTAILDLSRQLAIPALSGWAVMADAGAVLTFGPRLAESYRRAGYFVDRILRGARAETLPIEQPTVLELVINTQAARQIALAVPPSLLARADRIID